MVLAAVLAMSCYPSALGLGGPVQKIDCGPPEEFGPGYLIDCVKEDTKTCCGYGFMNDRQTLCISALCQEEACGAWTYYTTFCPEDRPEGEQDASHYDAQEDEGYLQEG